MRRRKSKRNEEERQGNWERKLKLKREGDEFEMER